MIETECFKELNVLGPNNTPTPDLLINHPPPNNENRGCFPFRRQVDLFLLFLPVFKLHMLNIDYREKLWKKDSLITEIVHRIKRYSRFRILDIRLT